MRRRTEKCRNHNESKETNSQKINLSNGGEDPEKVQSASYGQSDEGKVRWHLYSIYYINDSNDVKK